MNIFFYFIPILLFTVSCNQTSPTDLIYSDSDSSGSNKAILLAAEAQLSEDVLMGQLPAEIVAKIERDKKLRYMQLINVIKLNIDDAVIYDLTFESYLEKGKKKTVQFDQLGNKYYLTK